MGFFQLGWPALAGSAAATLLGAWMGRMPGAPDQAASELDRLRPHLFVVLILSFGGTIERMLESFAWTMLAVVFLFLLAINIAFVPMAHWRRPSWGSSASRACHSRSTGHSSARLPRPPDLAASVI